MAMICINTHIQAPPGIVFDLSRIQKPYMKTL